jgi:cytochrome oxidase Cu insertion factor (SCO1/SenC/PrrC family)
MGPIPFAIATALPSAVAAELVLVWLNCRPGKREQRLTAWGHAFGTLLFVVLSLAGILAALVLAILRPIPATFPEPDEVKVLAVVDEPWDLRDLEGRAIDLRSLRGKVVFLTLWSTW